ncbi:MAG: sodium:proton antiporter [Scytonema sp. PMC 1069.18]|nr:sodium:proton antiporter [Scytonema sp. PMC 1069.18]MEC4884758.1 sodium:proton antiporter [Scytonema sp. PMC 1070.18]
MAVGSASGEESIATNLKHFLLVLSVSLGVATLPQIFNWFRQIPYTLLLVIVGLGLAFADVRIVYLSPQLILLIFLPPLLFEAAWNLEWSDLKKNFLPVFLFAVIGVVISVAGIALGLNQLTGLSLTTALLVGASLAATDPVSVTSLFRELGVGTRLLTIIEGESLFNDGMAVVAFSLLVGLPLGNSELSFQHIVVQFFKVVSIGIAVGGLIGFGISYLTQRFDSPIVEQSFTLVSAYATYLLTEDLGGSAVIGVVTTGLILGNFGSRIGMNPRTRIIVTEFWEFLAFFVNSMVFLLIGDQVRFASLAENLTIIAVTFGVMTLVRAIAILFLSQLSHLLQRAKPGSKISWSEQTILWWGGVRGSVSIALALSVPMSLAERETIISTVFGAVLCTLLFQGLTIKPLVQKLKLSGDEPLYQQYTDLVAQALALRDVLQHVQMNQRPGIKQNFYHYQEALVEGKIKQLQSEIEELLKDYPDLQEMATRQLQEELSAIAVKSYSRFLETGRMNRELSGLVDWIDKK